MPAATKQHLKPVTYFFRLFMVVCVFGAVTIFASLYLFNGQSFYQRRAVVNTGVRIITERPATARPADAATTFRHQNTTSLPLPANQTLTGVSLHCKTVCSKSSGDICVPLDLAIFVYKDNIQTQNMTFDLQMHYPIIRKPKEINGTDTPTEVNTERCSVEDHFPGVELIPRQSSCAVIGNSGILNNSSCGDYIDSHDFVIRANMGLIKGYEVDVGRTANLTAFNRALMFSYSSAMGSTSPAKQTIRNRLLDHVQTIRESILWYPKQLFNKDNIYKSGKKFQTIIETIRKNGYSGIRFAFSWKPIHVEKSMGLRRTGTLGLDMYAVARTFCSNITLFGFYPFYKDLEGRDIKYHYFDDLKYNFSRKKGHDFLSEHTKLKELDRQGNITLVVRDCKPRKQQ